MTLQQLYYFQTIATTQHYRIAAEQLNVAQPTLSRSMAILEEELGLYLFEKSGRNVVLTKCGKVFLENVNIILQDVDATREKMKQLVSSTEGHIDIGYVSPLAKAFIPRLVRAFLNEKDNDKITFSLKQNSTPQLISGLKGNVFDVVFGSFVEQNSDLAFTAIHEQNMVAMVSAHHPLASQDSIALEDFATHPVIAYDGDSSLGSYVKKIFSQNEIQPNIFCEASDEYAIASLVEQDFGIALVADCHALHQSDVKILPLKDVSYKHTVYMIHNKNLYQIPAVKKFLKFATLWSESARDML